jgi:hypothetical protein
MLHNHEAVVVPFQDGHELEGGDGAANVQLYDCSVQPAEDAGVVAADEEHFIALQFQVAVESTDQQISGGYEDTEGLRQQGYDGVEFDFHDKELGALEISG